MFLFFSCNLTVPCNQRVIWFYRWKPLMISHHLAKFGGHKQCGTGNMYLVVE